MAFSRNRAKSSLAGAAKAPTTELLPLGAAPGEPPPLTELETTLSRSCTNSSGGAAKAPGVLVLRKDASEPADDPDDRKTLPPPEGLLARLLASMAWSSREAEAEYAPGLLLLLLVVVAVDDGTIPCCFAAILASSASIWLGGAA